MSAKKALVDFHFHSIHSDGSETIESAIKEAKKRGVIALALTDHNNGEGVGELVSLCRGAGIAALEGVEIYAAFPLDKDYSWSPKYCGPIPDFTILGRKLDWGLFRETYQLPLMRYWANYWLPETLEKLAAVGLDVPYLTREEVEQQLKDCGTPRVILDVPKNPRNWLKLLELARQFEPDTEFEAIGERPVQYCNRYLYANGKPAYVLRGPKEFGVMEALVLAKDMGGVLFAAHPGGGFSNWSEDHFNYFFQCGGRGIEVWQYFHSKKQIRHFLELAVRYNLLVSGGSDWHGKNSNRTLGCWDKPAVRTPSWVFSQLWDKLP